MHAEASHKVERLYPSYLARIRQLRTALHHQDTETLRSLELELPTLSSTERAIVTMAVHDVVANLPRRAKAHFVRTLQGEEADAAPTARGSSRRRPTVQILPERAWRPARLPACSRGQRQRRPGRLLPGAR